MVGTWMIVLDRCFVIDLRNDNLSKIGCFLLTSENQVSVEDACVNHGVAFDAERKHVATASQKISVDGDGAFEVLDCKNRRTGGNAANDRNLDRIAWRVLARIFVGIDNLDAAAQTRRAVDVAFLDEGCENGADPVRRRNFEMVAYFADCWRHAVFFRILLDVFVDFFLPCCHIFADIIEFFHFVPLVIRILEFYYIKYNAQLGKCQ